MKTFLAVTALVMILASCSSDVPASAVKNPEYPRSTTVNGSDASSAARTPKTTVSPEKTMNATDCVIKGNVSVKGEKIYHIPWGGYYDRTEIDESAGERWFCTEEEARAAGWRKSKR